MLTHGRLATSAALLYAAALLTLLGIGLAGTFEFGSPGASLMGLAEPASLVVSALLRAGLLPDRPDGDLEPAAMAVAAAAGLAQAAALWGLARWRLGRAGVWSAPSRDVTARYRNGRAAFAMATGYAALTSAVMLFAVFANAQDGGSMAGVWLFPLLGPSMLLLFLPFPIPGVLTFAGPVQAWVFWRAVRGRREPLAPDGLPGAL